MLINFEASWGSEKTGGLRKRQISFISGFRTPEGRASSILAVPTELSRLAWTVLYIPETRNILNTDGNGFKTSTLYKFVVSFEIIVRCANYNQLWPDHKGESGGRKSPKLSGGDILLGEVQIETVQTSWFP